MRREIRLDTHSESGYSTVLVAEDSYGRSIHWGSITSALNSHRIVTVQASFLSVFVDEEVVGYQKLKALRDAASRHARGEEVKIDRRVLEESTTPENRRDAAIAAIIADHPATAAEISWTTLFDTIVDTVLRVFIARMTPMEILRLLDAAKDEVQNADRRGYDRGVQDTKAELRDWLGVGRGCSCGPMP